jgi:type III secretion protein F
MDFLNDTVMKSLQTQEDDLKTAIQKTGSNPSTADLLALQQGVSQWSMTVQIQSTMVKELSDAMKGVIQKAS